MLVVMLVCVTMGAQTKRVAVLGDSYSTFEGAIPKGNAIWYFKRNNPNQTDVNRVEQTWWSQLIGRKGWTLLMNEHRYIDRGKSHIIIAGMENDGDGIHFPQKGEIKKTLKGIDDDDFIIMLEHDPSSWRRKIIPDGRAQLTLSGHTHKMQFALFDWCPMSLTGKEVNGWYTEDEQSLFVSAGLGGLIPFRFGAPGEIVVITLKTQQ